MLLERRGNGKAMNSLRFRAECIKRYLFLKTGFSTEIKIPKIDILLASPPLNKMAKSSICGSTSKGNFF